MITTNQVGKKFTDIFIRDCSCDSIIAISYKA